MTPPTFSPEQTLAVALISAISRQDISTATRIVRNSDNPQQLAVLCATIAAHGTDPRIWDHYLALIIRNETEAMFSDTPPEDE